MAATGEWTAFSRSLSRASSQMRQSDIAGVLGASLHVKKSVEAFAAQQHVGRLGRVGYDVKGTDVLLRALDRRAHLPERGTKAHVIQGGYTRSQIGKALRALYGGQQTRRFSTQSRKQALAWPGGAHPVNVVNHPGERPRPFFWPGVRAAVPGATAAYADTIDKTLVSIFR